MSVDPETIAFKVFDRAGLKVGVMGCTAPDLARLSSAETMAGDKALPGSGDPIRQGRRERKKEA